MSGEPAAASLAGGGSRDAGAIAAPIAYGLLLVAPLCMASNVVIGRAASEVMPPVGLAFWRWVAALAILLPFAAVGLRRHASVLLRCWGRILVLGALGMGVCGAFVYIGLEDTTATNAGLIYAASPVLILVLSALWYREAIGARQVAGIVLALSGVAMILTRGDPAVLAALTFNVGDLWILGATVAWAAYSVMLRGIGTLVPTLTLFAAVAAAGVICLAPFYAAETWLGNPVVWSAEAMASVFGVALVASVLAFSFYQIGVRAVGPSRAGVFMYLMPVYAALLGVVALGEALEAFHAIGFGLILPGLVLATLRRR